MGLITGRLSSIILLSFSVCVSLSRSQELFSCLFESGTCGLNQDNGDDFDWERGEGTTQTPGTGPDGGADGSRFYLFVETSNPRQPDDVARITTDRLDYTGDICISFYYHMFGSDMGALNVYLQNGNQFEGSNNNLWRMEGDQGNAWISQTLDVRLTNRDDRIGWQATRGTDFESDMAIDSLLITEGTCDETSNVDLTYRCDFEDHFCNMRQRIDDDFDWTRQSGRTPSSNTGPSSAGSGNYYIFIETSDPADPNDEAVLESPDINYRGDACVEFKYHMFGNDINQLVLYTTERGRNNPWRVFRGAIGDVWEQASIDVELNFDKVVFVGIRGADLRGDIGLDDLVIREGVCDGESPEPATTETPGQESDLPWSCSFDAVDLCDMFQNTDDQFSYLRQKGSTDTSNTGPSNGRTGSADDYYIYAESSAPRREGDQAIVETPAFDYSGTICVKFYYHMYGENMGRLLVYLSSRGSSDPLVEYEDNQGDEWKFRSIETTIGSRDRVIFLSEIGSGIRSDIALDDIDVTSGSCDGDGGGDNEVQLPWTCSFSNTDLCQMNQFLDDDDDEFDYARRRGSTPTTNTGPGNGRTGSPNDYYLYAEASTPQREGDTAIIETPNIDYDGRICLTFYYHMYGNDMGNLVVFQSSKDEDDSLVNIQGNQGNSWKQRSIETSINSGERILFLSEIGDGAGSDVAIDDIDITTGDCQEPDIGETLPWSCSFSNSDLCEMNQLDDDTFDFIRKQGSTSTSNTGPTNGRTGSANDYYLYAEASGRTEGHTATIETPPIEHEGDMCVEFYYHMYGSDMGSLVVYRSSRGANDPLAEIEDDQGNSWKQRKIETPIHTGERLVFMALMGDGSRSDIALDDINIKAGDCDEDGGESGENEELPWICSFTTTDICGMEQETDDDFDFSRLDGSTSTSNTGPTNGRTGSSSDYYLYTEASAPQGSGDTAIVQTPGLDYSGAICLKFYYHMYGTNMGKLVVYRSSRGSSSPLVEIEGDQGNSWKERNVETTISRGEKIVFMGELGSGIRSDMAIDDITIETGDCDDGGGETEERQDLPWICSFDSNNLCEMSQDQDDDFDYTRQRGTTSTSSTGPTNGRTGSANDYYIYTEATSRNPGEEAIIETPPLDYSGDVCVKFYFHMYGSDMGKLTVYRSSRGENNPLVEIENDQGNSWQTRNVQTNINAGEKIVFKGEIGDGARGDLALDDIEITQGDCLEEDIQELPWACSFGNSDLCSMIQSGEDDFDYIRQQGSTTTSNTGPSNGRTGSSSDYYIYAEASGRTEGQTTIVQTPPLGYSGDVCVKFYYHMYGSNMGSLVVYRSNSGLNNPLAEIENDQGNSWQSRSIETTINSGESIMFRSEIGDGTRSDIALDDLEVTEGDCEDQTGPDPEDLPWSCSFGSSNICDMVQSDDDDFDYTRQRGSTTTSSTGPNNGRTGSSSDYYIYAEASGRTEGERAIVETPPLRYNGDICVKFYYHMYGSDMGNLLVYRSSRGANDPLVLIEDDQGNSWQSRSIEANINSGESIKFRSEIGDGTRSDIAIDDIEITEGDCDGDADGEDLPWACSFSSSNLCDMVQAEDDDIDYTRQQGATDTSNTGPSNGRSGASNDYFIFVEASSPQDEGDQAVIETPPIKYSGTVCVEFYYHMYGSDVGRLVVYRSSRDVGNPLFERANNQGNTWEQESIETTITSGEKIVFLSEIGDGIRGDIALDDIRISTGDCDDDTGGQSQTTETEGTILAFYTCDTEDDGDDDDNCRMRQDSGDDFQWTQMRGRTPSGQHNRRINGQRYPTTGPSGAREGDYYLYIEASGRRSGDMARMELQGRDFERNGDNCLRFWYSMNGHHTGELRVYTLVNGDRRFPWSLAGDQLQDWHRAAVSLDMDDVDEIGLEATVNGEYSGDISVDDIKMDNGPCQEVPDPYTWVCEFEFDDDSATFCDMAQSEDDTTGFDWILQTGGTPSRFTGPDDAFNGDYYIYIEASQPRREGDEAIIYIPALGRSGEMCVTFRYHMYGHHTGQLEMFTQRGNTDTGTKWRLSGDQGKVWSSAEVTVDNLRSDERIAFRGIRGPEYSGDIALDNIRVKSGEC